MHFTSSEPSIGLQSDLLLPQRIGHLDHLLQISSVSALRPYAAHQPPSFSGYKIRIDLDVGIRVDASNTVDIRADLQC